MGLGGISMWQLLVILLIVITLFGTKKLRSMGGDLGSAVKGFKKAMNADDEKPVVADATRPLESDQDKAAKQKQ